MLPAAGQDVKTVATLGHQPVILGGLYSAIEEEFLPGLSLWNSETVKNYINTIHHPFQAGGMLLSTLSGLLFHLLEILKGLARLFSFASRKPSGRPRRRWTRSTTC